MKKGSIWTNIRDVYCDKLNKDMEVDALIIGGGSTLLELQNYNLKTRCIDGFSNFDISFK